MLKPASKPLMSTTSDKDGGLHNICAECGIDYPMFAKRCLKCGQKLKQ